jgi:hypothetical protein
MDPNTEAQFQLLQAQARAIRSDRPPVWHIPRRIHHRSHISVLYTSHANGQRRLSLWLLSTSMIRVIAWTLLIAFVAAGLAHVAGFGWARNLAASIPFVALISLYANWATDLGASFASYAALVASDVHSQVAATGSAIETDIDAIEADIAKLADLQPGTEAAELSESIRARVKKEASHGGKH